MSKRGLRLTSDSFGNDETIPARHTCEGSDISPPLEWNDPPAETRSFTLIMEDLDAPGGIFTHWVLFDIPATTRTLAQDVSGIGLGGRNDFQHDGYGGPCPPPNHPHHRYSFRLHALDVRTLGLEAGSTREQVENAMEGHVLQSAELVGRFERRPGPVK